MNPLHLFYAEPDPDRWLLGDRYPRRWIRRLIRGPARISGHQRVFLNLCAGLDRLKIPYRVNDYRSLQHDPQEIACVLGKDHLLQRSWTHPILLGPAIFSHPTDDPQLMQRLPVKQIVVPGEWVRQLWQPYWGDRIKAWPVGIDTDLWTPNPEKEIDILVYDKVRWCRDKYESELITPIHFRLQQLGLKVVTLRYGAYEEAEFHTLLQKSRAMIFLCEHETQGIAYQQALSCNVPILVWDRGGFWQDPMYFPERVQFAGVSSVPYWDDRCGLKFATVEEFAEQLDAFLDRQSGFVPRDYVLENLTLEKSAQQYVDLVQQMRQSDG
ncbi:MAG: glycosyltransferase [Oculatellaceae cyanobacterium bins.114]|nr:glycosyltransferase [Oculatellaceae cyanobacterium bins.114]